MPQLRIILFAIALAFLAACSQTLEPSPQNPDPGPTTDVSAPSNVVATALSTGAIRVTWEHTGDVDAFAIYREEVSQASLQSQAFTKLTEVQKDIRQFDDSNVKTGYTYRYQVVAQLGEQVSSASEQTGEAVSPTAPPVPLTCSGSATYTFSFTPEWTAASHPIDYPGNPHFSPFVGATHNTDVTLWQTGSLATSGIQQVAETGGTSTLANEINAARGLGSADQLILDSSGIPASQVTAGTTRSIEFTVNPGHTVFSIISMIAPSPDWFVGLSNIELCQNGEWISEFSREAFTYDAGTDSGVTYTSANEVTDPAETIFRITDGPFVNDNTLGNFSLTKN